MSNDYAIEFVDITKDFGTLRANENVNIKIKKGTIHSLVGENGAGKSTLMSILFGLYEPTSGHINFEGQELFIKDPNLASRLGIGMVHQHFKLVGNFSNLENIVLGSENTKKGILDLKIAEFKIKTLQEKFNLFFNLKEKSENSTVATQQKVEIMKMLYRDSRILIFDEPTAVLTPQEIEGLLNTIKIFKKEGKTIIFISHKLNEVLEISDEITVIRRGRVVDHFDDLTNINTMDVSTAMVGSKVVLPKNTHHGNFGPTIFKMDKVNAKNNHKSLKDISLEIKSGEILAIAGVEGNGQELLEFVSSGMIKIQSGKIFMKNSEGKLEDITSHSIKKRNENKLSYIPGDRHKYGLILDFDINDNAILRRLNDKEIVKFSLIKNKARLNFSKEIQEKYDVRGAKEGFAIARGLSGGNQQKVIVGREILTEHNFIIVVQPTRGLDVGAIETIHSEILKEKEKGRAILLISYELDEVLALADNIAVMHDGKIIGYSLAKNITREEIGLLMAGVVNKNKKESEELNG